MRAGFSSWSGFIFAFWRLVLHATHPSPIPKAVLMLTGPSGNLGIPKDPTERKQKTKKAKEWRSK